MQTGGLKREISLQIINHLLIYILDTGDREINMTDTIAELEAAIRALPDNEQESTRAVDLFNKLAELIVIDHPKRVLQEFCPRVLRISERLSYKRGQEMGDNDKAIEYYLKSLEIFKDISETIGEARALNGIGTVYQNTGEYRLAQEHHQRCRLMYPDRSP